MSEVNSVLTNGDSTPISDKSNDDDFDPLLLRRVIASKSIFVSPVENLPELPLRLRSNTQIISHTPEIVPRKPRRLPVAKVTLPKTFLQIPHFRMEIKKKKAKYLDFDVVFYRDLPDTKLGFSVYKQHRAIFVRSVGTGDLNGDGSEQLSLAELAGIRIGDILLGVNKKRYTDENEVTHVVEDIKSSYKFIRTSFRRKITIRPKSLTPPSTSIFGSLVASMDAERASEVDEMVEYDNDDDDGTGDGDEDDIDDECVFDDSMLPWHKLPWCLLEKDQISRSDADDLSSQIAMAYRRCSQWVRGCLHQLLTEELLVQYTKSLTMLELKGNTDSVVVDAKKSSREGDSRSNNRSMSRSMSIVESTIKTSVSPDEIFNVMKQISSYVGEDEIVISTDTIRPAIVSFSVGYRSVDRHVEYELIVVDVAANLSWKIHRRFRQFFEFREKLSLIWPDAAKFPFPSKKSVMLSPEKVNLVVLERQRMFELFLMSISSHVNFKPLLPYSVVVSKLFQEFLGVPKAFCSIESWSCSSIEVSQRPLNVRASRISVSVANLFSDDADKASAGLEASAVGVETPLTPPDASVTSSQAQADAPTTDRNSNRYVSAIPVLDHGKSPDNDTRLRFIEQVRQMVQVYIQWILSTPYFCKLVRDKLKGFRNALMSLDPILDPFALKPGNKNNKAKTVHDDKKSNDDDDDDDDDDDSVPDFSMIMHVSEFSKIVQGISDFIVELQLLFTSSLHGDMSSLVRSFSSLDLTSISSWMNLGRSCIPSEDSSLPRSLSYLRQAKDDESNSWDVQVCSPELFSQTNSEFYRREKVVKFISQDSPLNITLTKEEKEEVINQAIRRQIETVVYLPIKHVIEFGFNRCFAKMDQTIAACHSEMAKLPQISFDIPVNCLSPSSWSRCVSSLSEIQHAVLPADMLQLLLSVCHDIPTLLRQEHPNRKKMVVGADEFFPIFVYIVAQSNLKSLLLIQATLVDLSDPESRMSEAGYYVATFEAAVRHVFEYHE